jgi:hypothetical protein
LITLVLGYGSNALFESFWVLSTERESFAQQEDGRVSELGEAVRIARTMDNVRDDEPEELHEVDVISLISRTITRWNGSCSPG